MHNDFRNSGFLSFCQLKLAKTQMRQISEMPTVRQTLNSLVDETGIDFLHTDVQSVLEGSQERGIASSPNTKYKNVIQDDSRSYQ